MTSQNETSGRVSASLLAATNWLGVLLVITGATLVALNSVAYSKWAYIAYPLGNSLLLFYFAARRDWAQVLLSTVMLGVAALGFVCWIKETC